MSSIADMAPSIGVDIYHEAQYTNKNEFECLISLFVPTNLRCLIYYDFTHIYIPVRSSNM